jgi:Domain of unknown function (DUF4279)
MTALDENPNCARTHATFRLTGDSLDPDEISAALGIPAGREGTIRRQRTRVWLLASEHTVESTSLERHLIHLLDAIEPAAATVGTLRREYDLRADFFCYWLSATGHGGPELSPDTLRRIAELDAVLGIDFYGPAADPD